jgi:hypothetical protein
MSIADTDVVGTGTGAAGVFGVEVLVEGLAGIAVLVGMLPG